MFSHTAEYALRAVVWLAGHPVEPWPDSASVVRASCDGSGHTRPCVGHAVCHERKQRLMAQGPAVTLDPPPAAASPAPGRTPQTTQEIARATGVPAGYLSKVLQALVKAGVVDSQRGLHGGFRLAISPDKLSIMDVVTAVHPIRRYDECPVGISSHQGELCPLHARLEKAAALVEKDLSACTIDTLLHEDASHRPLVP